MHAEAQSARIEEKSFYTWAEQAGGFHLLLRYAALWKTYVLTGDRSGVF